MSLFWATGPKSSWKPIVLRTSCVTFDMRSALKSPVDPIFWALLLALANPLSLGALYPRVSYRLRVADVARSSGAVGTQGFVRKTRPRRGHSAVHC